MLCQFSASETNSRTAARISNDSPVPTAPKMTSSDNRDSNPLGHPNCFCSHRTKGLSSAAAAKAKRNGINRDSKGPPAFHINSTASTVPISRMPSRSQSCPRSGQLSWLRNIQSPPLAHLFFLSLIICVSPAKERSNL